MPENTLKNNFFKEILRGSVFALILSVFFVLIFALMARIFSFNANIISTINMAIKVTSVFCAVAFFAKISEKGFIKGIGIAIGFLILSYIVFVFLGGKTGFDGLLHDLIFCIVAGIVGGVVAVNRKK